ncbi:MAG: pectate lyase [Chitinophagaceae bacterium]|nr:MAG: pectate lyase [Chitinophagaceae bacterium]
MRFNKQVAVFFFVIFFSLVANAQEKDFYNRVKETMMKATMFMVNKVSYNGGYASVYRSDLSYRRNELEAYKTQVGVYSHSPGTVMMGDLFLDCYEVTGEEYYYAAAVKAAETLIYGQLPCGGWNYFIDFAGDRSLKQWYNTIGKYAWGWDEYNHYYGNATFKDGATEEAAMFLLRIYMEKLDPVFKPALYKAIDFIINSQSSIGGWTQRYPQRIDRQFTYAGKPDYTSHYVFNKEDVIWRNIKFLIQCYISLGEERFLSPIRKGMNFYLIPQLGNPQGGWALQYDKNLHPTYARQYEPTALSPQQTYDNAELLINFYKYTGDRKFLARIPDAIRWIESCKLSQDKTENGKYTHAVFIELGTNKPLYAHRKGYGVISGTYWIDDNDQPPLPHYGHKTNINIEKLKQDYDRVKDLSIERVTENALLLSNNTKVPKNLYFTTYLNNMGNQEVSRWGDTGGLSNLNRGNVSKKEINEIINSLDNQGRWLSKHLWVSTPYQDQEKKANEINTALLSTPVGGAPIVDSSNQQYISIGVFVKNMSSLLNYINKK